MGREIVEEFVGCIICGIPAKEWQSTKCQDDANRFNIDLVECCKDRTHIPAIMKKANEWYSVNDDIN